MMSIVNDTVCHLRAFWWQGIMKTALKDKKYKPKNMQSCNHKLHTWKNTTHKHIARIFQKSLCTHMFKCAHVLVCTHGSNVWQCICSPPVPPILYIPNIIKYLVNYIVIHTQQGWMILCICLGFWVKLCAQ